MSAETAHHNTIALTPAQRDALHAALIDAFNYSSLTQMLRSGLNVRIEQIAPHVGNLNDAVYHIINFAEWVQQMHALIVAARNANPLNRELEAFAKSLPADFLAPLVDKKALKQAALRYSALSLPERFEDDPATLLQALPLDTIPDIATLPTGSRMAFSPNPHFVGREDDMLALAQALKEPQGRVALGQVALSGIGGIGKTQLAVEFAHRYGQFFAGGVYWLSFADPALIASEVADCAGAVRQDGFAQLPEPERLRLVQAAWQAETPRLLLFDNLDDENAVQILRQWRPKTGGCRVLVTSRRGQWNRSLGLTAIRLETLPPDESVKLLRDLAPQLSEEEAATIAYTLGHFPLALYLAGSYLDTTNESAATYLQRFEREKLAHRSLRGTVLDYSPTKHDLSVEGTFAISWKQLDETQAIDRVARWLLQHAACFAPGETIPRDLLQLTLTSRDDWPFADDAEAGADLLDDAGRRLSQLGLVTAAGGGLRMHRLVALFVEGTGRGKREKGTGCAGVEKTVDLEAIRLNSGGDPRPLRVWRIHLTHITDNALAREDDQAARLANELAFHLRQDGNLAGARPYYERALAIWEKVLGPEHPDTALSLNNLGALLDAQGDLAGARPYYERALAIWEKVLGPEHPDTALSLNNLGYLLRAMGDYEGARPYYKRALAIRENVLGLEHPDTAQSFNNLGALLQAQGDLAGARPYYERALAICEKVLGPEHPHTASSLWNLGALFCDEGNYADAVPLLQRTVAIFEQKLGAEHPNTKNARSWLDFATARAG